MKYLAAAAVAATACGSSAHADAVSRVAESLTLSTVTPTSVNSVTMNY